MTRTVEVFLSYEEIQQLILRKTRRNHDDEGPPLTSAPVVILRKDSGGCIDLLDIESIEVTYTEELS